MELRSLVRKIGEEIGIEGVVRNYVVKKLAQQLYDCVECHQNPRAETDWLTAEKFVNETRHISLGGLVDRHISEVAGLVEVSDSSASLPDAIRQALQDFRVMDLSLGRKVWDHGYQSIKHWLPRPPYGRVLFH